MFSCSAIAVRCRAVSSSANFSSSCSSAASLCRNIELVHGVQQAPQGEVTSSVTSSHM
ncbi:hypothetical protein ACGFMK_25990 [Amycolatopsis sp. NPDC049252]|uniref:hypothetical protein n=1 Tax=Amycolatopsis sp. NPDC049252 TaxID=3363933 RepID=UPI003720CC21